MPPAKGTIQRRVDNERSRIVLEGSLNPADNVVVDLEESKLTFGVLDNWYMLREVGLTLCGPPPRAMIPEISQSEFVETVREQADECDAASRITGTEESASDASG